MTQPDLNQKNQIIDNTFKFSNLSLKQIILGIGDTWSGIVYDVKNKEFKDIITKNNRLIFIGITFFVIGIILYLYDELEQSIDFASNKITPEQLKQEIINTQKIDLYKYINDLFAKLHK